MRFFLKKHSWQLVSPSRKEKWYEGWRACKSLFIARVFIMLWWHIVRSKNFPWFYLSAWLYFILHFCSFLGLLNLFACVRVWVYPQTCLLFMTISCHIIHHLDLSRLHTLWIIISVYYYYSRSDAGDIEYVSGYIFFTSLSPFILHSCQN